MYDNVNKYGETFVHEVCHSLGLNHTMGVATTYSDCCDVEESSFIAPLFGCTNYVAANDYFSERYPCSGPVSPIAPTHSCYIIYGSGGCDVAGTSDNVMSRNGSCNRYLSPQQAAVLHFNLTTILKSFLTPNSFSTVKEVNTAFDYNVTSDEIWQNGDRYIKGNITVKAGKTLTIKCGVAMTNGAKIIVEKTALLVVDGGTITNISGRTWDGIYVWGDPLQSQAVSSGMPVYQGMAKFINGAVISHAKVGVRNYRDPFWEYGGIILGGNSSFLNNYIDAEFKGSNSSAPTAVSASKFSSCHFKTTEDIGDNLEPFAHVNLYKSVGVCFYGCDFEYTAGTGTSYWPNTGYGINAENSKFYVDKNGGTAGKFKNLGYGIWVNNYNPIRIPTISNCQFIDNLGYGAYFMNVNYLIFQNNFIQNPGSISAYCGVYLNNCKYYTIKNNTFVEDLNYSYKTSPGLEIFNSGNGTHQVYKNSFSNLSIGINAMGNNSGLSNNSDGLKMNCNDFTRTSNVYDIALDLGVASSTPSVMRDQGAISNVNSSNTVRNMYAATCNNTNQNKWYIHSSSNKIVNHGCNATSVNGESTRPSPQPACSRSIVNTVTISAQLDYTLHCGVGQTSSGGTSTISSHRLESMNSYFSELREDPVLIPANHFEIQATIASKLNLFLTDTVLNNLDSVITILENDYGSMDDVGIQIVFAYMEKGNYEEALARVRSLADAMPDSDWPPFLTKLIELEQDTLGLIHKEDSDLADFFRGHAASDNKAAQSFAQAILKSACDSNYTEPHNYPEGEGERRLYPDTRDSEKTQKEEEFLIQVYPNPAQTGVTVYYSAQAEGSVKIELKDLVGRVIYTNFINGTLITQYIPMHDLSSGIYLVTLTRNKELIFKTKIIKEK